MLRSLSFGVRRSAFGAAFAWLKCMVAKRYDELEAYQLAEELKREVYALLATGPASKDFKFCNQLRDSVSSSPKNIAEGFGRFRPAPFAQFTEFAIGSTMETQVGVRDGIDRGYFSRKRAEHALSLAERSIQVSTKLLLYLKNAEPRT